jgi:hypothetical protein
MARIGENVDPSLGRADTKGILLGSMEGAAAIGQGLAAAGQDLAAGMKEGRERKVKRKGAETRIEGLLAFYEDVPQLTGKLTPLLHALRSDEVRGREKDAIIGQITPLMDMFRDTSLRALQKEATDFQRKIVERQTVVQEKQARTGRLQAKAQLRKGGVGPFNELGYRFGNDGTIQYQSVGFEAADKSGVEDLLARKDALATVDTDLQFLKDFRKTVEESTAGENVMGYLTSKLGDAAATKYAENFTSFSQDFAQRLAKARNGARVTDADVENAKKAIFNLAKTRTTNLQLIDRFTKELTDRKAEVERADEYLANNKVMIGYKGWQKGESLPGLEDEPGAQGGTGDGSALAGMADEERGIQRPLPVGGDDFAGMLRDANFSAADLEEWNSSNNAQKAALLGKLQKRAGLPAQRTQESPGGRLGTTAKEQVMESVLNPAGNPEDPLLTPEGKTTGEFVDPQAQTQLDQETLRFLQERASGGASLREGMPAIGHPYLEGRKRSEILQVPMEPVTPAEEEEMLNEVRARRARLGEPQTPTTETSSAAQFEGPGGPLGGDFRDSQYQIPGGQTEVGMGDQRFLAKSVDADRRLELTRIPTEIKKTTKVIGDKLPRATAASAQALVHAASARLKLSPTFNPSSKERASLRAKGMVLLNLDSNHPGYKNKTKKTVDPAKRVLSPRMIIPDDASPETRNRARMAVSLMDNLYEAVHGKMPGQGVNSRVLTTTENVGEDGKPRGRKGVMHSELFAVTDNKMVSYLKTDAGMKNYAAIFQEVFGDMKNIKMYLPHSESSPGAATDKGTTEADLALRLFKFL